MMCLHEEVKSGADAEVICERMAQDRDDRPHNNLRQQRRLTHRGCQGAMETDSVVNTDCLQRGVSSSTFNVCHRCERASDGHLPGCVIATVEHTRGNIIRWIWLQIRSTLGKLCGFEQMTEPLWVQHLSQKWGPLPCGVFVRLEQDDACFLLFLSSWLAKGS